MKVFIMSHIADADGVFPIVLTDLAFEDYDFELLDVDEVDNYVIESLDNHAFDEYDKVFMTDLCISSSLAEKIDKMDFKNKFLILDHHASNEELNKYSFIEVHEEVDGRMESASSLYYSYLLQNYPNKNLIKESVSYMTTLVKLGDTWEWKKLGIDEARYIGILLNYYGPDKFILNYAKFLRMTREFYFTEAEMMLVEVSERSKKEYIESMVDKVIIREVNDRRVGFVFAEQYRSDLGNFLAEYYKDSVDLIAIINLNRSLSFRGIKDDVDVFLFASLYGGKGHKLAAGAPLPLNIREHIIDYIFKGDE